MRSRPIPRRLRLGFWVLAAAFAVGLAYSSSPTPLYPIYDQRFGYGPITTTVIFAAYPTGAILSFLTLAHVSDWIGRRRAVIPALLLEMVSAAMFALSTALPVLIAARLLCGIGVAVLASTATAWLVELDHAAGRDLESHRSHVVATAANLGGVALGPLVAGAIATTASAPLVVPFVCFTIALPVMAAAIVVVPDRFVPPAPLPRYRLQRIVVPAEDRRRYLAAALGALAALSTLSLFTALVPGFLTDRLGDVSPIVTGAVASVCCAAAAGGQIAAWRLDDRALERTASVLVPLGVAGVVAAAWSSSLPLFIAAALVSGAGAGVLFRRMLATVAAMAPADARAGAFAGMYLIGFLNGTLPVVGLGVISQVAGPGAAATTFGCFALGILLWVTLTLRATAPPQLSPLADGSSPPSPAEAIQSAPP
jgi:MFS family permease